MVVHQENPIVLHGIGSRDGYSSPLVTIAVPRRVRPGHRAGDPSRGCSAPSGIAAGVPVAQRRTATDRIGEPTGRTAIVLEELEDLGPLDHRPNQMGHPQDDVAAGLRQVGPRPLVVQGKSKELQETPDRVERERLGG